MTDPIKNIDELVERATKIRYSFSTEIFPLQIETSLKAETPSLENTSPKIFKYLPTVSISLWESDNDETYVYSEQGEFYESPISEQELQEQLELDLEKIRRDQQDHHQYVRCKYESPDQELLRCQVRCRALELGLQAAQKLQEYGASVKVNDLQLEVAVQLLEVYKTELQRVEKAHEWIKDCWM